MLTDLPEPELRAHRSSVVDPPDSGASGPQVPGSTTRGTSSCETHDHRRSSTDDDVATLAFARTHLGAW